jgi:hypothetical protein
MDEQNVVYAYSRILPYLIKSEILVNATSLMNLGSFMLCESKPDTKDKILKFHLLEVPRTDTFIVRK